MRELLRGQETKTLRRYRERQKVSERVSKSLGD